MKLKRSKVKKLKAVNPNTIEQEDDLEESKDEIGKYYIKDLQEKQKITDMKVITT